MVEKKIYIDEDNGSRLFDSYDACLVFLLMNMSSAYMELRHYTEAIKCLDECETICGEKIPDIFFRRSQARTYNKKSDYKEFELALIDIERAKLLKNVDIYNEHFQILSCLINSKKKVEFEKIESIKRIILELISQAKYAVDKINQKKLKVEDVLFDNNTNGKNNQLECGILKEYFLN